MLDDKLQLKIQKIENMFKEKVIVVAFSGGVDSSVIGYLAKKFAKKVILVTGESIIYPKGELSKAKDVAQEIGAEQLIIKSNEMQDENFLNNPHNRCYYCKVGLSKIINNIAKEYNADLMVDGTNYSDIESNDYRPGTKGMNENNVISPLVEAKITKQELREIARYFNLSIAETPSMACLASRIPYSIEITKDKLLRIDKAEHYLKDKLGIKVLRVRDHDGIARIEIAPDEIPKIIAASSEKSMIDGLNSIHTALSSFGFSYVTLDLKGYRTGSLNEQLEEI